MESSTIILVWGTQLSHDYNSALRHDPNAPVVMIESEKACRALPYHKQKLAFILTAMREFGDELRSTGRSVVYRKIDEHANSMLDELAAMCDNQSVTRIIAMRHSDRTPQLKLEAWCKKRNIELVVTPNTLFLTPTSEFNDWAQDRKVLQMETFYRWQRKRLSAMMDGDKPIGGTWNYDHDNRKPLPKGHTLPNISYPRASRHYAAVAEYVIAHFADNSGSLDVHWLPTTRTQAEDWLRDFVAERLPLFGDYEDAMKPGETFLYHSALSALLNIGLLHPKEVLDVVVDADVSLHSKEGFVRQIIGWREFMFGLYNFKPQDWKDANYLGLTKKLEPYWWKLDATQTHEPPLQDALRRLDDYGYSHHIERLMVFGNYMLLSGYDPKEVYTWFLSMYVDAYEWVMVPNVIGMSQYADGGLDNGGFATKPYISGSNYLQKMGSWWPSANAAKESKWTTLYWKFLETNYDKLKSNHRLRPLLKRFDKE